MKAAALIILATATIARAEIVNLAWDYPEDLVELVTFNLKRADAVEGPYLTVTNVPGLAAQDDVPPGKWFYQVTAVDRFWGTESPSSNTTNTRPPVTVPPGSLTISRTNTVTH